jgi:phage terminase large subunit GpA-like protein
MDLIVETDIVCPHCGEAFPLQIDTSQRTQSLIEDCTVCCSPISLTIHCRPGAIEDVIEER